MKGFIRVWKECDLKEIEKHLIVVGELSSECFCCHKVGIDSKSKYCPYCKRKFKYMGFRRKINQTYLIKLKEEFPEFTFIDFEDFKRTLGKKEAKKILNI